MTNTLSRPSEYAVLTDQPPPRRGRFERLVRGRPDDPAWARPSLLTLLVGTAVLYLWNLGASGYANSFYTAAVQAGTKSWKAFFFGSFDSANYITVDKPPASLWVMELSGRIFGFSSWSMLAPQAIEGVIAVGLLYGAVRRVSGHAAGLVAGAALALTPAAALMFRFNNPDAFLVLLLVAGAWFVVRALETGRTRWLLLAGSMVGLGFITKMGQALLVVPAFGLVYLLAGPPRLGKRILQLLAGLAAMVVSAGWWIAAVELTPASDRPYIGGSTDNNILNLAFGYNGFGRLFGGSGNGGGGGDFSRGLTGAAASAAESASSAATKAASSAPTIGGGGGGMQNSSFGGATGITRLFSEEMGLQISWLLPAALIGLVSGLWFTRRAPRTDLTRAALVLWGGWLLVTGLVFSYMKGTIHPYYTVALAPAVAGLVATSGIVLWRNRSHLLARLAAALMIAGTAAWSYHLLGETSGWYPWLKYLAVAVGVVGTAAVLLAHRARRIVIVAAVTAGVVAMAGSGSYALATTTVAHSGSTPTVGSASSSGGMGGFGGGSGGPGGSGGSRGSGSGSFGPPSSSTGSTDSASSTGSTGSASSTGSTARPPSGSSTTGSSQGSSTTGSSMGGGDSGTSSNSALVALLKASTSKWAAATDSSQTAAPLELSSGKAVMSIGGFSGSDSAITLAQFKALVAAGKIHYYIAGGGMGGGGGTNSSIASWVESTFTSTTVGGTTVYDLTSAK